MIFPVNACAPLPYKAIPHRTLFREAENTAMPEEKKVTGGARPLSLLCRDGAKA